MSDIHILYSFPTPVRIDSLINIISASYSRTFHFSEKHDFWEVSYHEAGQTEITLDGVAHVIKKGQMIIYPPGAFHEGMFGGQSVCIAAFSSKSPLLYDLCVGAFDLSPELAQEFTALVRWGEKLFECRDTSSKRFIPQGDITVYDLQLLKNRLESFLLSLYKELCCRSHRSDSRLLPELVYILRANLAQSMSVEELAQSAGISVTRVKKLFHEAYGCGPIHYFLQLKIEEAQKILVHSRCNVSQTAQRLGFSSVHYFSRLFKEKTGLSPREYVASLKNTATTPDP